VVDHEDTVSVAALLATIEREHGRLDVLVNDIFGGDRYAEWDKPLWEHRVQGLSGDGCRRHAGPCAYGTR
jgi:NAD(P)-dependent dehydrogenase (short-subunit alcohol dehydrogenase family)